MRGKPRSRSRRPPFPARDGAIVSSFRHFCGGRMPRSPPRRESIENSTFLEPPLAWKILAETRHFFGGGLGKAFYGGPLRRQWRPLLNTLYKKGRKSIEKTYLIAHRDALRRPLPCEQRFLQLPQIAKTRTREPFQARYAYSRAPRMASRTPGRRSPGLPSGLTTPKTRWHSNSGRPGATTHR